MTGQGHGASLLHQPLSYTPLCPQPHQLHLSHTHGQRPDRWSLMRHTHPEYPSCDSIRSEGHTMTLRNPGEHSAAALMTVFGSSPKPPLVAGRLKPVSKDLPEGPRHLAATSGFSSALLLKVPFKVLVLAPCSPQVVRAQPWAK